MLALVASFALAVQPLAVPQSQQDTDATRAAAAIAGHLDAGNIEAAVGAAGEALARYPDDPGVVIWSAHAYRRGGQLVAAAAAYDRAAEMAPDNPEIPMGQAAVRQLVGDLPGAAAAYERAIELAPDFAAARRAAATVRLQMRDHDVAAEHYARYIELEPGDTDARYLQGVALYFAGQREEAIEALEESRRLYPDSVEIGYGLAVVLAENAEGYERAASLLETAIAADFEPVEARYLLGRIRADQRRLEEAVTIFETVLQQQPDHRQATYRLALALQRLGRRDEAAPVMARFNRLQQEFNAAETRDKLLQTKRNELATAIQARDAEMVEEVLGVMLKAAPEDPDVLVSAAKVWLSTGREEDAFVALEAASQIDPQHWEASYLYGAMLLRAGRAREALTALERSLSVNPLFSQTHAVTGNALAQLGAPEAAVNAYLAAIDLEPDNPGYWLNLAAVYGEVGRADLQRRAQAEYQRLIDEQAETRRQ